MKRKRDRRRVYVAPSLQPQIVTFVGCVAFTWASLYIGIQGKLADLSDMVANGLHVQVDLSPVAAMFNQHLPVFSLLGGIVLWLKVDKWMGYWWGRQLA